jgi:membrane fusion protein (multidrug efflux system)
MRMYGPNAYGHWRRFCPTSRRGRNKAANLETKEAEAHSAQVNVPITDITVYSQLRLAEAARQEATATVKAEEATLSAAQHKVQEDEARASRAERDRVRYQALVEKREISRSDYDARETEAIATAQTLEADRADVIAEQQKIAQLQSQVVERQAQTDAAQAAPQKAVDALGPYPSQRSASGTRRAQTCTRLS